MTDNDTSPPPKITDAPAAIWLVYGDIERDCTHQECNRNGDVGWCDDKQFDSDVEYVRSDTIEAQAERIRVLEHLVIDAAYTLDKARIWSGMGWTYNPLHPVHYTPMRERLHNECDSIEAARAALEQSK